MTDSLADHPFAEMYDQMRRGAAFLAHVDREKYERFQNDPEAYARWVAGLCKPHRLAERIEAVSLVATRFATGLDRLWLHLENWTHHNDWLDAQFSPLPRNVDPPGGEDLIAELRDAAGVISSAVKALLADGQGIAADLPGSIIPDPKGWETSLNLLLRELDHAVRSATELLPGHHGYGNMQNLQSDLLGGKQTIEAKAETLIEEVPLLRSIPERTPTVANGQAKEYTPGELAGEVGISDETLRKAVRKAGIKGPGQGQHGFRYRPDQLLPIANARVDMGCKADEKQAWAKILIENGQPEIGSKPKAKPKPNPK